MPLLTGDDYRESLRDGRQVWISGERVTDVPNHPALKGMVDAVARIYDMHHDPLYADLMTFELPEGGRGARIYQIPTTREELSKRRLITAAILGDICPTMDRFGDETVTPLFVLANRQPLLDKYDTRYAKAAMGWLHRLQRENLFLTSGNTDPKGDRSLQPFQQHDLDMNTRVVKETDAGIVIRGAKFETGAPYGHIAFIKPTVGAWVEENRDYAISCILPLNAPGVRHLCRAPLSRHGDAFDPFDQPLGARFDELDTLIVMDDVFIPWENVLFSRQPELAALLRSEFSRWSAQAYLARCQAKADLLVGAALLAAEQAGTIKLPPVRSRISQLMVFKATIDAYLLGAEAACETTEAGFIMPNQAIQNAGRVYCSMNYSPMVNLLRDIAGGTPVMLPDRAMLESPETAPDIEKYFRVGNHSAETRLRTLALLNDLTASPYAGRAQAYQMFAETPVHAQEAALFATFDRDGAIARARAVAGLEAA
ncbi:4-hydroxyphenylacetate 3-hydroxylase family protein [Rhodovarius lipocyclicus]|uniref:4-hydroxyphenylacetate 3-hydroxylase family protein n=1 Tax=Rhodovarius lipocyclicus TaxID=268410 RepID=UPI00135AA020|nr:4-hydroxyphenylacetate 3-hydroxylase N-terminal domain-containing protein [Rhodovarius lipocyclicus]